MFNLTNYLKDVEGKLPKVRRNRESKVNKQIVSLVDELIGQNEPTTIKTIANRLNKRPQHIHQIVRKSDDLKKVKVKGFTLIVPNESE